MTAPSSVKPPGSQVKGVTTPPAGGPILGLAEAAKACGVSVSTLRRKRPQLKDLGAAETAKGWQIPVTALITLGLMDRVTAPLHATPAAPPVKGVTTPPIDAPNDAPSEELEALRAARDELREKLADAEKRAAVAEAIASERERIIQTQASALRMLEASAPARLPANDQGDELVDFLENVSDLTTPIAASSARTGETQERRTRGWSPLRRLLNR
jgi:hypothetical protein